MRVGTVRERKDGEYRVGLTPEGAFALRHDGHTVVVESGAGEGSGHSDASYVASGATIVPVAEDVWNSCDLVVKVKEPVPSEYESLSSHCALFTYLHLAADRPLTERLLQTGCPSMAYELVRKPDGSLPLLAPMSQVAGRMAAEIGAHLLKHPGPGRGKLLGGVAGVPPGKVVIIGSGTVATAAARVLMGLDARVVVMSRDLARLSYLQENFGGRIATRTSSPQAVAEEVAGADLAILSVLVPGAAAPKVLSREMVRSMGPGAVIVDVSIDQGGAAETSRADHAQQSDVHRRGRDPLLREQHARRRAPDEHTGAHQCDAAVRRADREPWGRGRTHRGRSAGAVAEYIRRQARTRAGG